VIVKIEATVFVFGQQLEGGKDGGRKGARKGARKGLDGGEIKGICNICRR